MWCRSCGGRGVIEVVDLPKISVWEDGDEIAPSSMSYTRRQIPCRDCRERKDSGRLERELHQFEWEILVRCVRSSELQDSLPERVRQANAARQNWVSARLLHCCLRFDAWSPASLAHEILRRVPEEVIHVGVVVEFEQELIDRLPEIVCDRMHWKKSRRSFAEYQFRYPSALLGKLPYV